MGNFNREDKRGGGFSRGGFGGGHKFGGHGGGPRQMFSATCGKCGQSCEVPFRPTGERPVFCSNCFKSQGGPSQRFAPKSFGSPASSRLSGEQVAARGGIALQGSVAVSKTQIDSLNAKLDKILSILSPSKSENALKANALLEVKEKKEIKKKSKAKKK